VTGPARPLMRDAEFQQHAEFEQHLERIVGDQLTRMCGKLSGRLLPAPSQALGHNHRCTCITTGNLQLPRQMGTETHQ